MTVMSIDKLLKRARPDVLAMKSYVSARSMHQGREDLIYLDANECPFEPYAGADRLSRYADQQPSAMMDALCRLYDVSSRNIMAARGADEAIDILVRSFCVCGKDNILICPPTFPMYAHSALLQGVAIKSVPLTPDFNLDVKKINKASDRNTKIVFVCAPNNPTGNVMRTDDIIALCENFTGRTLIVVDETYIEYATADSVLTLLERFDNLVVLRTLSKAYAAAGLRCGVAIAHADIITLLRKVLAPYPISQAVAREVVTILNPANLSRLKDKRAEVLATRDAFIDALKSEKEVRHIYPTDGNFVLVRVDDAKSLCARALDANIILRDQSHQPGLENCVRISIGTPEEMARLMAVIRNEAVPDRRAGQRTAHVTRKTSETSISVRVNLDETMPVKIHTGIGFYDHMLDQIARHGGFALEIECAGDLHIDPHHSVEDCAIALGQALRQALGDKRGIGRFGFTLPMDEALVQVALDLSGRFYLDFQADFPADAVGDLPTDLIEHIFRSLAENLQANLHIKIEGENTHHMVEACFKGFGRALRQAIRVEGDALPSTKNML